MFITILLIIQVILSVNMLFYLANILKYLNTGEIEHKTNKNEVEEPKAHVSSAFDGQKEIFQSTTHIIVPKTPAQIRNENFEKVKNGKKYGYID